LLWLQKTKEEENKKKGANDTHRHDEMHVWEAFPTLLGYIPLQKRREEEEFTNLKSLCKSRLQKEKAKEMTRVFWRVKKTFLSGDIDARCDWFSKFFVQIRDC